MAYEIERKFLVKNGGWTESIIGSYDIEQIYLSTDPNFTVRIRKSISSPDDISYILAFKAKTDDAKIRHEIETPITPEKYEELKQLAKGLPIIKSSQVEICS